MTWFIHTLVILCTTILSLWFTSTYAYGDKEAWRKEIDESIKRNFIGKCALRVTDDNIAFAPNSSSEFLIRRIYPTKHEYRQYTSLPMSLTKSDQYLWEASKLHGYSYEKWGKEDFSRWEIPTDHPGQDRNFCLNMTQLAGSGKIVSFYEDQRRHIERVSYIAQIQRAFIHPSGHVGTSCGYYMAQENCETRWDYSKKWHGECIAYIQNNQYKWDDLFEDVSKSAKIVEGCTDKTDLGIPTFGTNFTATRYKKVFIMTVLWDYNFHHLLADGFARMARFYNFLKLNPDVKIHVRSWEDYDLMWKNDPGFRERAKDMRLQFYHLFNITQDRFISGPILADEVYIPRCLHCSWALSNPIEIRLLAKIMVSNAKTYLKSHPELKFDIPLLPKKGVNSGKKNLVILQRTGGDSERSWNDDVSREVNSAFATAFPKHNIILMSSKKSSDPGYCLACDLLKFAAADVLVGEHGAGLTNMMFMPINSLVVELVGSLKDVSMPICGYYGPYAAISGNHHYLHGYDSHGSIPLEPMRAAQGAADFYNAIKSKQIDSEKIVRVINRTIVYPAGESKSRRLRGTTLTF